MGAETKISWCDSTFNPWIGCTKVSPGCANCYAEALMHRWGKDLWGPGKPRQRTSAANWRQPITWEALARRQRKWENEQARIEDDIHAPATRRKVFCGSLCDWLDLEIPIEWLADLLDLIRRTPHIDWLLLTKRPEMWSPRLDTVSELVCGSETHQDFRSWLTAWLSGHAPANVWIGTTVENQEMADKRIPELLKIPARVRFLSCEPLLGPVYIIHELKGETATTHDGWPEKSRMIDWVICGGESGPKARPMHPDWARSLRDQCKAAGVPFFFKQQGEFIPLMEGGLMITTDKRYTLIAADGSIVGTNHQNQPKPFAMMCRVGKARAGHLLDGVEHHEFPRVESEVQS